MLPPLLRLLPLLLFLFLFIFSFAGVTLGFRIAAPKPVISARRPATEPLPAPLRRPLHHGWALAPMHRCASQCDKAVCYGLEIRLFTGAPQTDRRQTGVCLGGTPTAHHPPNTPPVGTPLVYGRLKWSLRGPFQI